MTKPTDEIYTEFLEKDPSAALPLAELMLTMAIQYKQMKGLPVVDIEYADSDRHKVLDTIWSDDNVEAFTHLTDRKATREEAEAYIKAIDPLWKHDEALRLSPTFSVMALNRLTGYVFASEVMIVTAAHPEFTKDNQRDWLSATLNEFGENVTGASSEVFARAAWNPVSLMARLVLGMKHKKFDVHALRSLALATDAIEFGTRGYSEVEENNPNVIDQIGLDMFNVNTKKLKNIRASVNRAIYANTIDDDSFGRDFDKTDIGLKTLWKDLPQSLASQVSGNGNAPLKNMEIYQNTLLRMVDSLDRAFIENGGLVHFKNENLPRTKGLVHELMWTLDFIMQSAVRDHNYGTMVPVPTNSPEDWGLPGLAERRGFDVRVLKFVGEKAVTCARVQLKAGAVIGKRYNEDISVAGEKEHGGFKDLQLGFLINKLKAYREVIASGFEDSPENNAALDKYGMKSVAQLMEGLSRG